MKKYMTPIWNCATCKGLGREYFADSFDRDNGHPCPNCSRIAKNRKKKLILPFSR